jgi:hypothetical protein
LDPPLSYIIRTMNEWLNGRCILNGYI